MEEPKEQPESQRETLIELKEEEYGIKPDTIIIYRCKNSKFEKNEEIENFEKQERKLIKTFLASFTCRVEILMYYNTLKLLIFTFFGIGIIFIKTIFVPIIMIFFGLLAIIYDHDIKSIWINILRIKVKGEIKRLNLKLKEVVLESKIDQNAPIDQKNGFTLSLLIFRKKKFEKKSILKSKIVADTPSKANNSGIKYSHIINRVKHTPQFKILKTHDDEEEIKKNEIVKTLVKEKQTIGIGGCNIDLKEVFENIKISGIEEIRKFEK